MRLLPSKDSREMKTEKIVVDASSELKKKKLCQSLGNIFYIISQQSTRVNNNITGEKSRREL